MSKTIAIVLATAVIAMSSIQVASAAERHHGRKTVRAPASTSQQFRQSNAYAPGSSGAVTTDWSRYEHGYSALAGH